MEDYKSIMCDPNNLYEAYVKTVTSSKWKETTQKVMLNYLRCIFSISDDLENMTYTPGKQGEFILSERGKRRPITTSQPRDRIVRNVLCDEILLPQVTKKIIYDNGASLKNRGIDFTRRRFEMHLHKAFEEFGTNEIYAIFGDFSKFYDNIIHSIAKEQLLELFNYDPYLNWLFTVIFDNFKVDVSYMTDEEYENCLFNTVFDKLEYRKIQNGLKTGTKFMEKSANMGDRVSQIIGVYYPSRADIFIKYVMGMKYYGRFSDDWYLIHKDKSLLEYILNKVRDIFKSLGIHLNERKTKIVKLNRPFKFLQIWYTLTNTGHINKKINSKRVRDMKKKLKSFKIKIDNNEMNYIQAEDTFKSWYMNHAKIMSKQQRQTLLKLFETLFNKEVIIEKVSGKYKMYIFDKGGDTLGLLKLCRNS
jgi:hypothetical protein